MTLWWLMTLPIGFVALMLFFAWASHTGRLPRWGEATSRWAERHPILVSLPLSAIWFAGAVVHYIQGTIWLAILYAITAILWGFWGSAMKRATNSTRRQDRDSPP